MCRLLYLFTYLSVYLAICLSNVFTICLLTCMSFSLQSLFLGLGRFSFHSLHCLRISLLHSVLTFHPECVCLPTCFPTSQLTYSITHVTTHLPTWWCGWGGGLA